MKSIKFPWILSFNLLFIFMFGCKREEIILHGEISGIVTDSLTGQPLQSIPVILNPINDTTYTSGEGEYLFKSLTPEDYTIEVSTDPYIKVIKNIEVFSTNISSVNIALQKRPYPEMSDWYLDFGFDSTLNFFTIKNMGSGTLKYSLFQNQDWISVSPDKSEVSTETDTIRVRINRNGLSKKKHIGIIEAVFLAGSDDIRKNIQIYLNGFLDIRDTAYYDLVTIGTQTWMGENLNVGKQVNQSLNQSDNEDIEKYCYEDNNANCEIYGGLYQWAEAMQYNPSDAKPIGTTQGICPDGWHIPTIDEWGTLRTFIQNDNYHYGNTAWPIKEVGTVHWNPPNSGTDEYGFTALPSGFRVGDGFMAKGDWTIWWTSTLYPDFTTYYTVQIHNNDSPWYVWGAVDFNGYPVRCIKDSPEK
jgi:uncharacterized protein (TIGR02145 family)